MILFMQPIPTPVPAARNCGGTMGQSRGRGTRAGAADHEDIGEHAEVNAAQAHDRPMARARNPTPRGARTPWQAALPEARARAGR